ncbi:hypothetical protein UFOVP650_28 [uncultured Caudovirales phage]|uniref:Uncharacterized protein n=1 Tax=uncultured Caudovirales phage TaxID=2100421 RepID=A0A6J5NB81_9CAUD|nr:hypothetical protein UFOVP650_28 [uncultured Caudovirales phage]
MKALLQGLATVSNESIDAALAALGGNKGPEGLDTAHDLANELLGWFLGIRNAKVSVEFEFGNGDTVGIVLAGTIRVELSKREFFAPLLQRPLMAPILATALAPVQLSTLMVGDRFKHSDELPPGVYEVVSFEDPSDSNGGVNCVNALGAKLCFVGDCSVVRVELVSETRSARRG